MHFFSAGRAHVLGLYFLLVLGLTASTGAIAVEDPIGATAIRLSQDILRHGQAYTNLAELVAGGSRVSGSEGAAQAVKWAKAKLEAGGLDRVWLQPVTVPHWVRGKTEKATIVGTAKNLRVAALGGSIGTPFGGVTAEVIQAASLKDVAALGPKAQGKIVFINGAMDPATIRTFDAYRATVSQRSSGAIEAAKLGAVAVLIRSLNPALDDHPHTGMMRYAEGVGQIPAGALSTLAADALSEAITSGGTVKIKLELSAQIQAPVQSYNVVGEITGSQWPDQIVVVGGHLDSWDLGPGAQDDGAGVVQSIEVLAAFKRLGIKPRRTVRVVLFMSEEEGGLGGIEYARQAKAKGEKHIAALESDNGGFTPRGFSVDATNAAFAKATRWVPYLSMLGADRMVKGDGETDIEPLGASGTALFGLSPDSARYFDYHHAETDTLAAVNPRELHLGAAAMAVLVNLLQEQGI